MDWTKIRNDRAKRQEEVARQEELIARKKQEIMEKLKNKSNRTFEPPPIEAKPAISSSSSNHTNSNPVIKNQAANVKVEPAGGQPQVVPTKTVTPSATKPYQPVTINLNITNKFKNDGSFLELFKSMQNKNKHKRAEADVKQEVIESKCPEQSAQSNISPSTSSQDRGKRIKQEEMVGHLKNSPPCSSINNSDCAVKEKGSVARVNQNSRTNFTPSQSRTHGSMEAQLEKTHSSPSRSAILSQSIEKEIDTVIKMARQESTREISSRNSKRPVESQYQQSGSEPKAGSSNCEDLINYDNMRWSNERTVDASKDPALCNYAKQVFGSTDLTVEQWRQLEDQRKMKALFEVIQQRFQVQPSQQQQEQQQRLDTGRGRSRSHRNPGDNKQKEKNKYAYDSDEEIDPNEGTWEHKKRRKEMEKTRQWAQGLTEMNRGKHHLGDYLPPHELDKFMKKWESIKSGNMSDLSKPDYDDFKIQCDNLGYKMMLKLGWKEGEGLGSGEAAQNSIKEPIKATSTYNGAGLGSNDPTELKKDDDIYEAYRKRMMLAYRFRPNPLNNPRRPYY